MPEASTRPYLLRAIYEWCTDNHYTPHITAIVDARTRVPMQFVKDGLITLNISFEATSKLDMNNEVISFNARFGGVSRAISVPVDNVIAIYARENRQGMAFDAQAALTAIEAATEATETTPTMGLASVPALEKAETRRAENHDNEPEPPKKGGKPVLTRIK